jgi:hypothetical protein
VMSILNQIQDGFWFGALVTLILYAPGVFQ